MKRVLTFQIIYNQYFLLDTYNPCDLLINNMIFLLILVSNNW